MSNQDRRALLEGMWAEVKDNTEVLRGCPLPHDFPPVDAFELRRPVCTKCGGWLDVIAARWYMRGLDDARRADAEKKEQE